MLVNDFASTQRHELEGCFVDYDGDRTILVTPDKGKQFEIEAEGQRSANTAFENISLAIVAFKKVIGEWNLKSGKRLNIKYPLAYLRKCLKTVQDEEREKWNYACGRFRAVEGTSCRQIWCRH